MAHPGLMTCQPAQPDQFDPSPVHQAIIDTASAALETGARLIVYHTSWSYERPASIISGMPLSRALRAAYRQANLETSPLPSEGLDAVVLEEHILPFTEDSPEGDEWWEQIRARYGDGRVWVLFMSRPGFSPDGRTAVLHYQVGCGPLCGDSHVAVVEFRDGTWRIAQDLVYAVW